MPLETATEPPFGQLSRELNRVLDQMKKGFFPISPGETWRPSVNVYENEVAYIVCVDLAGVAKESIDLQVRGQSLTLRGSRAVPIPPQGEPPADPQPREPAPPRCRVHVMEIDHGPFTRDVELPDDVAADKVSANYRNGMLWIELPKKK